MEQEQAKSPIVEGLQGMAVALSLECSRCGYELRGMLADTNCPECGEPIRLTIIESIDPAARRLSPIQFPKRVGNSITAVVAAYLLSALLAITALLIHAPVISLPHVLQSIPAKPLVLASACFGLLAFVALLPMISMYSHKELVGCRGGLSLTSTGLLVWSGSMFLAYMVLFVQSNQSGPMAMLFDTCLPAITAGIVFSGFKKLVPRLGLRSRAFRQAQGSRQRMNDLLVALVFVLIGRALIIASPGDTNLAMFGLIVMIMSLSLIVFGLGYLLRNTIWIRQALVAPPPALSDLLHIK
ncbi:MAG: hypothetical protein HOM36_07190 [Phycisphaerae bacterium]|nr:hypothetical protein [Phycisphaerae bacterium]